MNDAASRSAVARIATYLIRPCFRVCVFPVLLNFWPVLLLVSQKALLPLGIVMAGAGTAAYRRDLLVAGLMVLASFVTYALQVNNEYALAHLLGYVMFVLAAPLINLAVRSNSERLIYFLALFSVGNAILAFLFYALSVDLSGFRGLNIILGNDDHTHRVYFESTSIVAVFSVAAFRTNWRRLLATFLVFTYAIFLAKSVFVILLYATNYVVPMLLRGKQWQRLASVALVILLVTLGPMVVMLLRPDLALSIGIKLLQLETVADYAVSPWFGAGWGFVIDEIINGLEQPYQIEMQLPMLYNQIGLIGLAAYAGGMAWLTVSTSKVAFVGWLRWGTYMIIGFSNPWLFVPSWYLTSVLLYRRLEPQR